MISKKVQRHKAGVYKITNLVNGKKYIGSSINIYNRKHTHTTKLKNKKHPCKHLMFAYHKYGEDNFLFEVLEYCNNYTEREQYYLDTIKPEYNKRLVAQNNKGLEVSEQTRLKISESLKEQYKNGLEAYNQIHKQKEVEQYDLEGNYIQTFKSPKEAEKAVGAYTGKISVAVKDKSKYSYGFQWKYKNSNKIIRKNLALGVRSKPIRLTNIITKKYLDFPSLKACGEYLGVKPVSLCKQIKPKKIYKREYKLEYIPEDQYKSV